MTSLNTEQKQLLFDYSIGLTSQERTAEAEALICSNQEAAEIHSKLKSAFAPLDSIEPEPCPDSLAEATISRLNNAARSGQLQLEQLLATEQSRTVAIRRHLWSNFGKVAAAAAVILIAIGILFPPLQFARAKQQCQMQFARIFDGIHQYTLDHDGEMPEVARAEGAPWWKVAYPGEENHSNTRCVWLLVKGGYVKPVYFVCPARRRTSALQFATLQVEKYNDFPAREYITYSFQIRCPNARNKAMCKTIMADLNPLSERLPRLPKDYPDSLKLEIDEPLLNLNSINHNRRGQNVLFGDGSAKFIKVRHIGITLDDIYMLQEMSCGCEVKGCETPSCEEDAFLAP